MPASVAQDLKRKIETAIQNEHTALAAVSGPAKKRKWGLMETGLKYSRTQLREIATAAGRYDDDASVAVTQDVHSALTKDADALDEAGHKPSITRVRALIGAALKSKAAARDELVNLASAPPSPTAGPLAWCVFITNNGNSSTESVKLSDPGAGGAKGAVTMNGQGLNQTTPFTFPANPIVVVPFNVTAFGTSTFTVDVIPPSGPAQTLTFPFTLDAGNDVTTTDCTPH